MLNKEHIENILCLNGVDPKGDDAAVREVLLQAKWQEHDIVKALNLLKGTETVCEEDHVLDDIFKRDARLTPETIRTLLGIDIEISSEELSSIKGTKRTVSIGQVMSIAAYSIALAAAVIFGVMWYHGMGLFYGM